MRYVLIVFLLPGDLICAAVGVPPASDHRQVLRSFINMMVWGAFAVAMALLLAL